MGPVEKIALVALEGGKDGPSEPGWNPLPRGGWDRNQKVVALVRAIRELGFPWPNLAGGISAAGVMPEEWIPEAFNLLGEDKFNADSMFAPLPVIVSAILGNNEEFANSVRQVVPRPVLEKVVDHLTCSDQDAKDRWRQKLLDVI